MKEICEICKKRRSGVTCRHCNTKMCNKCYIGGENLSRLCCGVEDDD